MMIITGGEPELCCSMARHSMLRKRVGSTHACMHSVCVSLIQNAVCMCCACVEKYENGDWRENLTYVKAKDGDTGYRQRSARMKRFAGLSHSSLAVRCAGASAFHFSIVGILGLVAIILIVGILGLVAIILIVGILGLVAITTTYCIVLMSVAWHGMAV